MPKHEEKICERCGDSFECKLGDIANCQCSEVSLRPSTRDFLEETFFDCLCKSCLSNLNETLKNIEHLKMPNPDALESPLHFYEVNGWFVFTETYHLLRGHCCRSGCRHCPYGFKKT